MQLMSSPAQAKYIILSILFVVAAVNFTRTTMDILKSSKRLENLKGEVSSLEEKRSYLEKTIAYKKTNDYVEERARDALSMVKQGEKVFVSPKVLAASTNSQENGSETIATSESKDRNDSSTNPNVQLWFELFFDTE